MGRLIHFLVSAAAPQLAAASLVYLVAALPAPYALPQSGAETPSRAFVARPRRLGEVAPQLL